MGKIPGALHQNEKYASMHRKENNRELFIYLLVTCGVPFRRHGFGLAAKDNPEFKAFDGNKNECHEMADDNA